MRFHRSVQKVLRQWVLPPLPFLSRDEKYVVYFRQLEMCANAQRDGRPSEYRWRRQFNSAVWLCSNAAKDAKPVEITWGAPN